MKLKDIKPYLDVIIHFPDPQDTFEIKIDNEKYGVFFYQASEFAEPCLFVCVIDEDSLGNAILIYGMVLDDSIMYEENSGLPSEVKDFVSKLVKLFPFI